MSGSTVTDISASTAELIPLIISLTERLIKAEAMTTRLTAQLKIAKRVAGQGGVDAHDLIESIRVSLRDLDA